MLNEGLQATVEEFFEAGAGAVGSAAAMHAFLQLRNGLERGTVRAAEPDADAPWGWRVNSWVKRGILLGFRLGALVESGGGTLAFVDKNTYPTRRLTAADGVRVVPGGSSIRAGAHVSPGAVCMPPMYINVGAFVGEGTMVDGHRHHHHRLRGQLHLLRAGRAGWAPGSST